MKETRPLTSQNDSKATLFLIEDDQADVFLVKRALAKHGGNIALVNARDGAEALEMLRGGEIERPFVILSDLNMPGMSGYEFLDEIRADAALRDSIIFVISSSNLAEDVNLAYQHFASGYIVKEMEPAKMARSMQLLFDFCEIIRLPS
ncbi:Response regulator receiver domain-containing protein [Cohaesibacter marisflavi]|uniref:Response regulator receiver domain-containing protein n=1 Tax=Cohaesibacter marisflavi TaxID=655353 RepID=A0A1I5IKN1_9HYPH|nr:Response regulator receiver domain-containing protein [Cohaesibacter marisflavi]